MGIESLDSFRCGLLPGDTICLRGSLPAEGRRGCSAEGQFADCTSKKEKTLPQLVQQAHPTQKHQRDPNMHVVARVNPCPKPVALLAGNQEPSHTWLLGQLAQHHGHSAGRWCRGDEGRSARHAQRLRGQASRAVGNLHLGMAGLSPALEVFAWMQVCWCVYVCVVSILYLSIYLQSVHL